MDEAGLSAERHAGMAGWFDRKNLSATAHNRKKKTFKKRYHLSVGAMAHIIERHYHRVQRHPGTGKFTVQLTEILAHIRDAAQLEFAPIPGFSNFYRSIGANAVVVFDRNGAATSKLTVITDPSGGMITAFPGNIR